MNMECAFQSPTKLYIVQDLMDGGDLHFNMMHRTRRKVFDLERVKWYAACCLLGLEEVREYVGRSDAQRRQLLPRGSSSSPPY